MKKILIVPVLVALASSSACARSADTNAANSSHNASANASATVGQNASQNVIGAANGAANATSEQEAGMSSVELTAGGLTTGSRGLHHSNIVAFGQTRDQVVSQISDVLGAPTGRSRNAECPSGAVDTVQFRDLNLNFDASGFAGWVIDGSNPALESYHGLKVGITRGSIDADSDVSVQADGTLGPEISVNDIGVLLDGTGQNARVTTLFSGVTCFAR